MDTSETYTKMWKSAGFIEAPTQDQLQEMLQPCGFGILLWDFHSYASILIRDENITSMEQLWLAFVMKEKYNKVWNGKEWL